MRVGVALPHYEFSFPGEELTWERVREAASWAEGAGFGGIWVSDHFFLDLSRYGGPPGPQGCYDPLALLSALSPVTESVALGTLVLAVGFRHPAVLAKAAASLDAVCGGRLELGIGAGWHEAEYRAAGLPFPAAGRRLRELAEAAELLRRMTSQDHTTFQGEIFQVTDAPNLPPPVRRPVPLWIGAKGDRALRVVARHADGWNVVWTWTPESYAERAKEFEAACREVGRPPEEVRRSVGLVTLVGETTREVEERFRRWQELAPPGILDGTDLASFAADRLVGTPEQVLERLAALRGSGMQELIVNFAPLPFAWYPDSGRELFAEEVLSELRSWDG